MKINEKKVRKNVREEEQRKLDKTGHQKGNREEALFYRSRVNSEVEIKASVPIGTRKQANG
jgi:hypothetical protein